MEALVGALVALGVYMTCLFVVSLITKNNGIADIGYGIAFMVVVGMTELLVPSASTYALLLATLPFIWATRLAVRIFRKNYGKPEDFRYKAWRDAWGSTFVWRSFLQIYMLQGLVVFVVALPVTLALVYPVAPTLWLVYLGLALWVVGFLFETIGDAQLDAFIRNPAKKGTIMMSGLWKYSRHPNYFGESTMWWGIAIAAAGLSAYPLVGFVSPLLITYLLLFVSGVPMLEKRWDGNPEWEAYKSRTSVFIPLPPRHGT
jgi:steroid 5-alpha reductase family enzyme